MSPRNGALAAEGRAIVWTDGGPHATETGGAHQLIETLWNLASRHDAQTLRILDQTVVLFVHANPDGQDLVRSWYMRRPEPAKRIVDALPRLYQKYIGHDNNRDFFMSAMKETTNINRQLYLEWLPQIVYNHHQSGPPAVVAGALPRSVQPRLRSLITSRRGGRRDEQPPQSRVNPAIPAHGSVFSTWWNGLRTTTYFHNAVGLLTETVGSPPRWRSAGASAPPTGATPFPVTPQKWHYAQSIAYSVSLNYAVLDYASRQRDSLLFGSWRMGRNSIERGSRDHWTHYPRHLDAIKAAHLRDNPLPARSPESADDNPRSSSRSSAARGRIPTKYFAEVLRKPELRDARGYILPADQPDFPTATKFIARSSDGISVHRATTSSPSPAEMPRSLMVRRRRRFVRT